MRKINRLTHLQNKKLKRRLIESASLSPPSRARGSSMVNKMSAVLLDSRDRLLPKFKSRNNSTLSSTTSVRSKGRDHEIRTGARERMSSPPHKDIQTASSYSTDFSSDTFSSSYNHRHSHNYHHKVRKPPPLVLPELSDSEVDQTEFTDANISDANCLSPCQNIIERRPSKRGGLSDGTASSTSASSCNGIPDVMSKFYSL